MFYDKWFGFIRTEKCRKRWWGFASFLRLSPAAGPRVGPMAGAGELVGSRNTLLTKRKRVQTSSGAFWTSARRAFSQTASECAHLSQCAHHREPRHGCDSSHYRLATPVWLIAGPGTAERLHISRHTHTYTWREKKLFKTHTSEQFKRC